MLSKNLISLNDSASSRKFANFSENTLNYVVSNSVGMAILALRARYFGESPDEIVLSQHYQSSISQLNSHSNQEFKPEIDYLIKRMMEEPGVLDAVTLFQPYTLIMADNSNYKKQIFALKEVFTLVWMALHDNTQFFQNYSGTIEDKTNAALLDLPQRIKTFFQILRQLKTDNNCHHGIRNELVFSLNKIHSDVDIIEDPRSTVLCEKMNYGNISFFTDKT